MEKSVSLEVLYRAYPIFMDLLEQKLPVATALKFRELILDLNEYYKEIQDIQDAVISTFAQKDANGVYEMPESVERQYLDEMRERLQKKVTVEWEDISTKELGKNASLSIKELATLSFLFNDAKTAVV